MLFQNVEVHNVAELVQEENGVSWLRVPAAVKACMEAQNGDQARGSTGVELRFVMHSDTVTLRMQCLSAGVLHIFRGGIQGGWEDQEILKNVDDTPCDIVIKKSANLPALERMTEAAGYAWDPRVVRVIFDRGLYKLFDVIGDVEPPKPEQLPQKKLLFYGSSITHGSNALDMSHSWPAVVAHNLRMDVSNLGFAGSCCMEPAMMDYIAGLGEQGNWDVAVMELGINVLDWERDKIVERVTNALRQVAGRNPEKPIVVISPFYCADDFKNGGRAAKWRTLLAETVAAENYPQVTLINGLELLGGVDGLSADEVHPNIYGTAQIANRLTDRLREILNANA